MAGQTLQEIRRLLSGAGLAPRHRLGQNFLVDLNLMRKLVHAADLSSADTVLEVGPGTGSLTELLLDAGATVVAVEVDRGLQGLLRERLGVHERFTLVQADALATKHELNPLVAQLLDERGPRPGGHLKLVANLPYQIATPLLVDLLLHRLWFERFVVTIQKEVGERLAAPPNVESYGPVSVLMQVLAEVTPLAILPPRVFWPRPKVESLMISVRPRPVPLAAVDTPADFSAFVHEAFRQRRKMLRRLLRDKDEAEVQARFHQAGVCPEARPAELAPDAWIRLYQAIRRSGS